MASKPLLMSLFALALLLPAMYRRFQRRTGAAPAVYTTRKGRMLIAAMASLVVLGVLGGAAIAEDGDKDGSKTGTNVENIVPADTPVDEVVTKIAEQVEKNRTSINITWLMLGGILVLFMQAGFALVETGFTRAKNAAHTMMMNMVIFALGTAGWFICGYALMFGAVDASYALGVTPLGDPISIGGWNILGKSGFFLAGRAYDVSVMAFFFFQLVFMDATATIPTGAMAERWKFSSFVIWGLFASMILYPIFGNWVWGGGWLSQLGAQGPELGHGYVDFAGSSVVHAMGGITAFWGAKILGPRIGKFGRDGTPNAIPGHHLPMGILGTFVLLVGWMGFNGGSTFAGTDLRLSVVITNTVISSAFGCLSAMFIMWRVFGKPDPSMSANGLLAGLVAITAPCAFVAPWAAAVIGIVAGGVLVSTVLIVEQKLKVDDPVGAVAVHGSNGIWGVLALGLFADGSYGAGLNGVDGTVTGLLYGDPGQLAVQGIGAATVLVFCSLMTIAFFSVLKYTWGMRSSEEAEIGGLDIPEMGAMAYPDFLEAKGEVFASPEPGGFWVAPLPAGVSPNGGREQPEAITANVRVVRNPESAKPGAPMYFFQVEAPGLVARLPVWRQGTPGDPYVKEVYRTELLGQRLERGNLASLEATVRQTIAGILVDGTLPRYLFRTPEGMHVPVFRRGRSVWAAVADRRFEGPDLGELRATVAEHLGIRAGLRHAADLELVALAPEDLRGIPPVFLLTHRDISVAVFARPWGALHTELAGQELEAAPGVEGVLALRREVANRLHDVGRLYDTSDLAITALSPETWTAWRAGVERADEVELSWGGSTPSYRLGDTFFAALPGPKGDLTVWLGRDRWDLSSRIEREARSLALTVSNR